MSNMPALPIEQINWQPPETMLRDNTIMLLATDREGSVTRVWPGYCRRDGTTYWASGMKVDEPILGWAKWPKFTGPSKSSGDGGC